jgi:hypothetical protein
MAEHKLVQKLTPEEKLDLLWEAFEEARDRAAYKRESTAAWWRVFVAFATVVGFAVTALGLYNGISALFRP